MRTGRGGATSTQGVLSQVPRLRSGCKRHRETRRPQLDRDCDRVVVAWTLGSLGQSAKPGNQPGTGRRRTEPQVTLLAKLGRKKVWLEERIGLEPEGVVENLL